MARFLRPYASVEALRFDGTRASAIALAKAFPRRVALGVEHDDGLLALSRDALGVEELREVAPGSWLVVTSDVTRQLDLMSDEHFRAVYTPYPTSST